MNLLKKASLAITTILVATNMFAKEDNRPNILFVIADDWGKHAQSYGTGDWINMPTFDKVASEGILFNNLFTSNPKCGPCRASITTGRNTWQLKNAVQHFTRWPAEFITYPDILMENGYHVGFTGKGWGPGEYNSVRENNPAGPCYDKYECQKPAAYFGKWDHARNFIEYFMKERPEGKPFCFWMGFTEPHRPYEDGAGLRSGKKLESVEVPSYYPDKGIIRSDMLDYAFEAEYMDKQVAKVLEYLKETNQLDNTIVIYTSDHGMPFPRVKGQIYDQGFSIPLAIRWGKIAKPRVENTFVNVRDFAPTFLEAAGVPIHKQMTGKSFLPLLKTQTPQEPSKDQFHLVGKERHDLGRPENQGYPIRAIRTDEWLLIRNYTPDRWPAGNPETYFRNCDDSPTKLLLIYDYDKYYALSFAKRPGYELYNIKDDNDCMNNLAYDPKYQDLKHELYTKMIAELKNDGDFRALGQDTAWVDKVEWVGNDVKLVDKVQSVDAQIGSWKGYEDSVNMLRKGKDL